MTDSSQGTRSPTPLLKRGDLRHRLTRKLFNTPNADLTREVHELRGVVTTLQKKLEEVAPTISTNQTRLDPSDLRLRLTSRSDYGQGHESKTDPSYQPVQETEKHVTKSVSCFRRETLMEDSTNSPPVLGDEIRDRRGADQRHCPQERMHAFKRKVHPQGRTSHKTISGPCLEEFTPPREDSGYPLSKAIEKAKLPPNFRMPQCDLYDGSGDPGEHVYQFQTNMLLIQKHFVSSRTRRKNSASLLNVVQERNESLSRYLGRFNAATLEIDNLDESVKYTAFMRGLGPMSKFAFTILHEIKDKQILEKPDKMRSAPSKRDRNLWCRYHNDHGHTTDNCESLKCAIEALIKCGHLRRYINRRNEKREATPLAEREECRKMRASSIQSLEESPQEARPGRDEKLTREKSSQL
ncbi:hypothetical protein RJ639_007371 [Escallonia herrerae]|uniref:Retrotransposon gag domain-containing protein n=1 Tax=Escallonia herrerae TaxID=1293975 RepID=A0AA89AVV4_9ASTE|nr:hypothetical protein RJ639_007371 [Escallonia herrerae]